MLNKEYKFYKDNRSKLLKKYKNRFIVIKNNKILGDYITEKEAYENATTLLIRLKNLYDDLYKNAP